MREGLPSESSLTAEQRRAVASTAHALEIRAGAGTGKTTTLAHRVARMAASGVPQHRLVVVTFTREATASVARRLALLLGRDHRVQVLSFHQWAARELPPEARRFLPEEERRRILLGAVRRQGMSPAFSRAMGVATGAPGEDLVAKVGGFLSYVRNSESSVGAAVAGPYAALAPWEDGLVEIEEAYREKKDGRLDFDDLLLAFRDRLKTDAAFRAQVAARVSHLFVDEYQDVNQAQAQAVQLLTTMQGGPAVTVVGDPRQSIYGFRGASPSHLDKFLKAYPKRGERVALTVNFRSDAALLEASNVLLPDPHPLRPRPRAPAGEAPRVVGAQDVQHEARLVADHVERLLAQGADPAEVVVLARARHLAGGYQEEVAERMGLERWAADNPSAMDAAVDAILGAREPPHPKAAAVLLRRMRVAGVRPRSARELLALPRGERLPEVALQTIHAAKGLEWDHVVLLGAREGGLPVEQAVHAPQHVQAEALAEERRLLYVAATRARRSLLVTWPERGDKRAYSRSRFLAPLDAPGAAPPVPVAPARPRRKRAKAA